MRRPHDRQTGPRRLQEVPVEGLRQQLLPNVPEAGRRLLRGQAERGRQHQCGTRCDGGARERQCPCQHGRPGGRPGPRLPQRPRSPIGRVHDEEADQLPEHALHQAEPDGHGVRRRDRQERGRRRFGRRQEGRRRIGHALGGRRHDEGHADGVGDGRVGRPGR